MMIHMVAVVPRRVADKDKLKVRMLEKPGACIPLDTIYEGPRNSPFAVFAVQQSQVRRSALCRVCAGWCGVHQGSRHPLTVGKSGLRDAAVVHTRS
jgi:hypothetical protein